MSSSSGMLRVGLDLGALLLEGRAPGTVKMATEQAHALLALPTPWHWCLAVPEMKTLPFPVPDGVEVYRLPGVKVSQFSIQTAGRLWDRLRCAAAYAPGAIAPLCRTPVVATYFDSNIFEHGWTWIASGCAVGLLTLRALAWHTLRVARRLLTNSEYCRAQILRRYPRLESKLYVNPVGVTPLPAPPDTPPTWAKDLRNRPFFLCAGAFSENKGQRRLLGAWKRLQAKHPDLPLLLLLGPCTPDYWRRAIVPALHQLPRANEVIYPGHVSVSELSWAFHHAHGYVQPSIAEGFSSFSVFDAMACGVPVACSNSTSHPEGTGGAVRFFDPYRESDIADAIVAVWRDDQLRQDLSARGQARVKELSWQRNAETVIQHLNHIINRSAS